MTAEPAIDAIRADPASDAPRLAYAEHCETGDPARAELIRLQCRVARSEGDRADRKIDRARADALVKEHRERWIGPDAAAIPWASFTRGFLERVEFDASDDPALLERLIERHPIHRIGFSDDQMEEQFDALTTAMQRWAAAPVLSRVQEIQTSDAELGPDAWRVLLGSPHLTALDTVVVADDDCTPEVAGAVAESLPEAVRSLTFAGWMSATLGDEGTAALANSARLSSLTTLSLWNCLCTAKAAASLAASPHLGRLEVLSLGGGNYSLNQLGAEGGQALGGATNLQSLRVLNLNFNKLTDAGGGAIPESEGLPNLEVLAMQACELTNVTARCFMSAHKRMPNLRTLDLSHNDIDGGGLDFLARCRVMEQLEVLWLYHNNVWPSGVYALCDSFNATNLKELNLTQNPLGKESAKVVDALIESPALQGLDRLMIERCGLADDDRERLREHFGERVRC